MSEQAPGGYREKYFQALKEQERIEKQSALQLELMRKTLFQLAAAASGMDQQLDASVARLRETMRGGSGVQVVEQLERVQQRVADFEHARDSETMKAARVMSSLIDQYQKLQTPNEIKASLKEFRQNLSKRLHNFRQYPLVLEDLVKLQELALSAASDPQAGLWTRLKGGRTLRPDTGPVPDEKTSKKAAPADAQEAEPPVQLAVSEEALIEDGEDGYTAVATRIARTLKSLVDRIDPNDVIRHRMDIVRHRIERGMDWYVLSVTLEDIRDMLLLRYIQADEEFSAYLAQVRVELSSIREALTGAGEKEKAEREAAATLSESVNSGVARIKHSIAETGNVDTLKQEVTQHISDISEALKRYRERPQEAVSEQLQALMAQVESIEKESLKTREALEEQRYKATHDSLTGLPNREAWVERAHHEMQRFQRYGHPLTLCVCDLDKFKHINDTYGHQAGDKVLKLIAKVVSGRLRNVDFIARYGGEEFVLLLPETAAEQAFKVLDKIRAAVAKTPFRFKDNPVQITLSFGIAEFQKDEPVEAAFERADKALYQAKDEGRNRCVIAPS